MNISTKCPCGERLEITHISLKQDVAEVLGTFEGWREEHRPHREAAHAAHVRNLEQRGLPLQELEVSTLEGKRESWAEA